MKKNAYKMTKKEIIKTMTFMEAFNKGLVTYKDIDDFIDEWHTGDSKCCMSEFLGMTKEQFKKFAEDRVWGRIKCN